MCPSVFWHISDWVSSCDAADIRIKACSVQTEVDEYCQSRGGAAQKGGMKKQKPYLREAFVDAIVEFIVADDQVSII